jgi:tRNA dimethylallyltransferase
VGAEGSARTDSLPVVVLAGPTAVGKSEWALRLAEALPVEIVSVDSALVYRGMDVGTAKPSLETRARIPHHLIDILDPTQAYSAGRFAHEASQLIDTIRARGRIPLLVGGTMLYLRALLEGIAPLPHGSSELRRAIDARAHAVGWPKLHAELQRLDPQAAARIHPRDAQRIQRALEVHTVTGRPLSQLQRATPSGVSGPLLRRALVPADRGMLHERIAARLAQMMARGFLAEVEQLRARGDLTAEHPSMRAVGYRQLWAYLDGCYDLSEALARAGAATRQLAKRQLTWLRAGGATDWIDPFGEGSYDKLYGELRRELDGVRSSDGAHGRM